MSVMAPCEPGPKTSPVLCPNSVAYSSNGFNFWNRLNTLPVIHNTIQTTMGLYEGSKEKSRLIGMGLGYLEYGVSVASDQVMKSANTIAEKYPVASIAVTQLDTMACNALETLETKVPVIQKPPSQIIKNVGKGASTALHSGVRKMMKTYPGQKMVEGLDNMIAWSETAVDQYEEDKQKKVQAEGEANNVEKETEEKSEEELKSSQPMMTLKNGMVIPIRLYLQVLKVVKHMLVNIAGLKTKPSATSSPRKQPADMQRRKKVSPRKRLPKHGLVTRITSSAMSMLGLRKQDEQAQEDGCLHLKSLDGASNCTENCLRSEKRKHGDVSDDDDSDLESVNLASALDNYNSADDSDYNPGDEDPIDDSLEYGSGDTESDIETENVGSSKKGEPLQALTDKKNKEKKDVPVSLPSPKVVLQPEWKKPNEAENQP